MLEVTRNSSGTITSSKQPYHFGSRLVAVRDLDGSGSSVGVHSLHQDHLGTPTLQTSSSGGYGSHERRGPFGVPWVSGGSVGVDTDLKYTDQRSFESGLEALASPTRCPARC